MKPHGPGNALVALVLAAGCIGCPQYSGFRPDFTLRISGFDSYAEMREFAAVTAFEITGYRWRRIDSPQAWEGTEHGQRLTYSGTAIEGEEEDWIRFYFMPATALPELALDVAGGHDGRPENDAEMAWVRALVLAAVPDHLTVLELVYRPDDDSYEYVMPDIPAALPPRPCPEDDCRFRNDRAPPAEIVVD